VTDSVTNLLAADRVRFGHRRDVLLLVGLVPVLLAVMFISQFNSAITPPHDDFFFDPPDPVAEQQIRDQMLAEFRLRLVDELPAYAFPASLVKVAGNLIPIIVLAIYLSTALVAGEFEWGTVRTIHLTSSRARSLAVRIGVITGLVAVATALGLVLAAIIPFFLSVEGRPLQEYAAPVPGLLSEIGIRVVAVLPFIAIPAFICVIARSISLAFLLTLLFFVFDIGVTGMPWWPSSPTPWVPVLTVSGAISRLLSGEGSTLAALAAPWVSVVALLAWATLPVMGAIYRFRRLDLNE
jgi:ABC-2 type transport system permease protein